MTIQTYISEVDTEITLMSAKLWGWGLTLDASDFYGEVDFGKEFAKGRSVRDLAASLVAKKKWSRS